MDWLDIFSKVTPFVISMIGIAEKAFDGQPKSGAEKKKMVVDATRNVIGGAYSASTGGQKETWEKLAKPVDGLVDATCNFLFK